MKPVTITATKPLLRNQFINVDELTYQRDDDKPAKWVATTTHDTVHILIYNVDTHEILLTEQCRIPPLRRGVETCLECCAGIIDKYEPLAASPLLRAVKIAEDEIREELGYKIDPAKIQALPQYISSTGGSGATCYPFYCEVTNEQFVGQQLGPDEYIEIYPISDHMVHTFLENTNNTDATTKYLLYWWLFTHN